MRKNILAGLLILAAVSAHAELFSFYGITSNDPSGDAVSFGEAQLSMDVTVLSSTSASFLIANTGLDDNFVSKVCFDFAPEVSPGVVSVNSSIQSAIWNAGMDMGSDQLPGANGWFMSDICFTPKPPPAKKGILTGSSLEIILNYTAGFDILDALYTTDLRVGMHVQGMADNGLGDDYSESFINIPEPSTALLIGFIGLAGKGVRKIFIA